MSSNASQRDSANSIFAAGGSAGHGEPNPEPLGTMMPGDEIYKIREFQPGTNLTLSGAVLTSRDAADITWMRRPDGDLTEQH